MRFLLFLVYLMTAAKAAILGLDYGQQFTKAVLLAPGISFEIVLTDEGKRKDLSGISIRSTKENEIERVYGSSTGSLCTRFPESCILDIKQLLGKSINDKEVQEYLNQHFGIKLIGDEARSNSIKFDLGFKNQSYVFSVEEVFAMSLNEIKSRALSDLQSNPVAIPLVEDVAVAIPPFATHETKQAYLDALQLANFSNVLGLVDEGTAVALNYLSNKKIENYNNEKEYHLVYDMGAASTKATLFSFTPFSNGSIVLELHNIGYDDSFGGRLLTNSIYTIILEKFLTSFNLEHADLTNKISARILEAAEKAKIVLSANSDYHVSLESIYKEKDFRTVISRDEFEEINSDLMGRVIKPISDALGDVKLSDVKSVILNGGSTRVPFVQKHLATLVGEDKISKTVNTDESCALGTTLRGLKLKSKLEKPKDIKVIEKSYHNYEINVNDSSEEVLVFKKGSTINNATKIKLGKLSNEIDIGLYENGRLFKSYKFDDLIRKSDKLNCKSKEIFGTFKLDNNKMFDIVKLEIECATENKGSFFKKLLNKDTEAEAEVEDETAIDVSESEEGSVTDSNNSTNKTSLHKPKKQVKPISVSVPKPIYSHIKPMSNTTKERIFEKLSYLNSKDEEKIQLDYIKNILEGKCYELRSFIEDNEEILSNEISDLTSYTSFIVDTIEWLDFESDDAPIDEFKNKISELDSKKKILDRAIEISQTDLSLEGMKKLYEDGTSIIMQIQSHMLEFGSQISDIRQKFEKEGFNFDKENDRIKLQLLSKGENKMLSLDKHLAEYKEDLTKIGDLVQLPENKYNELSKDELFDYYDLLSKKIVAMLSDLLSIESSHNERVALFNSKFDKLLERKKQKEFRNKLKQEREAAKIQQQDQESDDDAGIIEEDDSDNNSSTSSTIESNVESTLDSTSTIITEESSYETARSDTSSTNIVHDEL